EVEAHRVGRQADGRGGLARLACRWEAARAEEVERANLARYDGGGAATAADRDHFIARDRVAPDRGLGVEGCGPGPAPRGAGRAGGGGGRGAGRGGAGGPAPRKDTGWVAAGVAR